MSDDIVVGITPLGHDLSVTVARSDGTVLLVAEEERYSRRKGGSFVFHPSRLIDVLAEAGVEPRDVIVLASAGRPVSDREQADAGITYPPGARNAHTQAWIREYRRLLPRASVRPPLRHHRAHASSAYYPSTFGKAAVVTIDGHGDGECCTISTASGNHIRLLERQTVPDSVSYLYRSVASYVGLQGHEREGKLMALAAYGKPVLVDELSTLFFDRISYPARAAERIRHRPCRVDEWVTVIAEKFGERRQPSSPLRNLHLNLAASIQHIFSSYVMSVLRHARSVTGMEACCVAGGAFVNSVTNGDCVRDGPFSDLFLPAWAGDVGLSIGAAARVLAETDVRLRLPNAYFGSTLALETVPDLAREAGLSCERIGDPSRRAAAAVAAGQIVGWARGRAEVGPRALGNRSILAHAANPHIRHELNRRKRRESWRPFGASLLQEEVSVGGSSTSSPFMNITVAELGSPYASALHVDGSSRIHTVLPEDNPAFAELLLEIKARTGTGAVINTSLNGPGQSIARTVVDCLETYATLGLDLLFIGDYLIRGRPRRMRAPVDDGNARLPRYFDLVVPYPNDESPIVGLLKRKARIVIPRPDLLHVGESAAAGQHDVPTIDLVIYNPWHNAVLHDTLPRVAAWAIEKAHSGARVVIVDCRGETVTVNADSPSAFKALYSRPPTDVEGHFLRRLAVAAGAVTGDNPWFPGTN